jgi:hypothetical protein
MQDSDKGYKRNSEDNLDNVVGGLHGGESLDCEFHIYSCDAHLYEQQNYRCIMTMMAVDAAKSSMPPFAKAKRDIKAQLQGTVVSYRVKCQTFQRHVTRKQKDTDSAVPMSLLATCNFGSVLRRSTNPTLKNTSYLLFLANYFLH